MDCFSAWGGRLPLLSPEGLDEDQRALDDEMRARIVPWAEGAGFAATTADGRFIGPMNIYLHRPRLSRPYLDWLFAEQRESVVSPSVREVVILAVGTIWGSDFQLYAHSLIALGSGLCPEAVEGIRSGRPGNRLSPEQRAAYDFTVELADGRRVSDGTYQRARSVFGEAGLIDLTNLIGMYLAASALLNAFEVPAPDE